MSGWIQKTRVLIYESPLGKTIASLANTFGTGFLTAWFISDITVNGKLVFPRWSQSTSVYWLIGFLILSFIYHRFMYKPPSILDMKMKMLNNLTPALEKSVEKQIESGSLTTLDELKNTLGLNDV